MRTEAKCGVRAEVGCQLGVRRRSSTKNFLSVDTVLSLALIELGRNPCSASGRCFAAFHRFSFLPVISQGFLANVSYHPGHRSLA